MGGRNGGRGFVNVSGDRNGYSVEVFPERTANTLGAAAWLATRRG